MFNAMSGINLNDGNQVDGDEMKQSSEVG